MLRLSFALFFLGICSSETLATPFSIKCERAGYYFLTFDEQTGRVIQESPAQIDGENRAYKGKIKKTDEDEMLFEMFVGGLPPSDIVYRRKKGIVDLLSGPEPSTVFVNCVPNPLRAALTKYDQIWPLDR